MPTVYETALRRRTIHDYAPGPVDESAVLRALEAAHFAPCHKCTWPWRFTRVGPQTREQLLAIARRLKSAKGPLDDRLEAKLRARMLHPGALIVVSQVLDADPDRRREDYAAVAAAIQNLCLCLASDGIGSKWGTGGVTRDPQTYTLLGIDSQVEQIVGFVWVGNPAREHARPGRPPLAEHLRIVL